MFGDPKALAIIAVALFLATLVTWVAARLVGRRLAKRNLFLARSVTVLAAPAIALSYGIVVFRIDSAAHPESDWPPMALTGAIMIAMTMLLATIPMTRLLLKGRTVEVGGETAGRFASPGGATAGRSTTAMPLNISMTRDSVCLADDVDAPHEKTLVMTAVDTLADVAAEVAASSYLPMPSDAWGWTIEAGDAVVVIRPGFLRRSVATLRGDPAAVLARDHPALEALYVRPGSRWRDAAVTPLQPRPVRGGQRGAA